MNAEKTEKMSYGEGLRLALLSDWLVLWQKERDVSVSLSRTPDAFVKIVLRNGDAFAEVEFLTVDEAASLIADLELTPTAEKSVHYERIGAAPGLKGAVRAIINDRMRVRVEGN